MRHTLPPLILLAIWFPIAHFTGPHKTDETTVREELHLAFEGLGEQGEEEELWASRFSGARMMTHAYPVQFDEREPAQYAQAVKQQVANPGTDICLSRVRITGIFAEVDLHYRRPVPDEKNGVIGQGRARLIREGSTWRIMNVEIDG